MNRKLKTVLSVIFDIIFVFITWIMPIIILRENLDKCIANNYYWFIAGIVLAVALNAAFKLYSTIWQYASISDAFRLGAAVGIYAVYLSVAAAISVELTKEWVIISIFFYLFLLGGSRFIYKLYSTLDGLNKTRKNKGKQKTALIIGAGYTGSMLVKEMRYSDKLNVTPVAILDDDEVKIGKNLHGVKVVGKIEEVEKYVNRYDVDEVIIAIPSATKEQSKRILEYCGSLKSELKIVPSLYGDNKIAYSTLKKVSITDLLGREQIKVNLDEIMGYIENKVVLVTGGGGSIGSELCRQIAGHNPARLIILDIYENNAYSIQQELLRHRPNLNLTVLIASVRNAKRIDKIFEKYRPQIVFHAAAHKHVPLMEESPNEAVKNNVGGTFNVADAAGRFGTQKFILISTDKAVNPTNVMGASKRICEMIVQAMDKKYDTEYAAVRFGNVLGSNGSVIPLFEKQIAEGGPVTVTHKDIVRYFMTIPEAVSLVLQAGAYAKGGEIFVLDMGEQVKIYDLAIKMIKLSGLEPFKDIDIKVTGLRPGEKLYEERLMAEEGLKKTANDLISIGKPLEISKDLFENIKKIEECAYNETDNIKDLVHDVVPTYKVDRHTV